MKIGTLTLHRSINYGGLLQSFALQYVLKNMGLTSEIIDYWFPGSNRALYGSTITDMKTIKTKAFFVANRLLSSLGDTSEQKSIRIQRSIDFIRAYLSKDSYADYNELRENALGYDAYICGSDKYGIRTLILRMQRSVELFRKAQKDFLCSKFGVSSLNQNQSAQYRKHFKD
jgi:hypothetical protein